MILHPRILVKQYTLYPAGGKDDMWSYLNGTLAMSLHSPDADDRFTADQATVVVGVPRIRQLRLKRGKGPVIRNVKPIFHLAFSPFCLGN